MRNKLIVIIIGIAIIALISFTIFSRVFTTTEDNQEIRTTVVISKPEIAPIGRTYYYSGTLEPNNIITLISKVPGKIEKLFVKKGDLVLKDEVLVKIEDNTVNLQKDQAYSYLKVAEAQFEKAMKGLREEEIENTRALIEQTEKDVQLAEDNLKRTRNLYENGAISKTKLEEAESMVSSAQTSLQNAKRSLKLMEEGASDEEIEIAKSNAEAARAQFELAKLQVDFTQLETPGLGIVADIYVDEGNMVGTSNPILSIVQIDPIVANIPIPETHYGEILDKKDQIEVKIFPNAFPNDEAYKGKVSNVSPTIDPLSRTFGIEISIINPLKRLRPGMYVNVELTLEQHEEALLVPQESIVTRNGQMVVFVLENIDSDIAIEKPVSVGISNYEKWEITEGISPNDLVIVEGNLFLEDQQKVQVFVNED